MEFFGIGFTKRDVIRSVWSFIAAFAVTMLAQDGDLSSSALAGAAVAGLIAVKNLILADGSTLKG
jgi:hypothetical protein